MNKLITKIMRLYKSINGIVWLIEITAVAIIKSAGYLAIYVDRCVKHSTAVYILFSIE